MKSWREFEGVHRGFVAVAAAVLVGGSAILTFSPDPQAAEVPALRGANEDRSIPVLGASIGQFPPGGSANAARMLRKRGQHGPWERVIVWRLSAHGAVVERLWLPASTMREAFALCSQLAGVPVVCAPAVTPANQLRTLDGNAVGESQFSDLGITPYRPVTGLWTKVV